MPLESEALAHPSKGYSLDFYTNITVSQRLQKVKDVINNMPHTPSQHDLEVMANYLMNAKDDETYVSIVEEKNVLRPTSRFNTFGRSNGDYHTTSLDALLHKAENASNNKNPVASMIAAIETSAHTISQL